MITLNYTEVYNDNIFPNNETYVDLPIHLIKDKNTLHLDFSDNSDLLMLQFIMEYIKEVKPNSYNELITPYLPYSRMDRQQEERLFALKYLVKTTLKYFDKVYTFEVHSDVSKQLLGNKLINTNTSSLILKKMLKENSDVLVVFPDAGAQKRYLQDIDKNTIDYVTFEKKRDFNTGKITSIEISDEFKNKTFKGKKCFIIDDLCSRGGTFIPIVEYFKDNNDVFLIATHIEENILSGALLNTDIKQVLTLNVNKVEHNKIKKFKFEDIV